MEARFEAICQQAGISYVRDDNDSGLDFFLPAFGVYVEVKQYHSPRIAGQMARRPEVIVIQGRAAMEAFGKMLGVTP